MASHRLLLIGFGNVGQGLTQILRDHGESLSRQFDAQFKIVAVCDLLKGNVYNPAGLSPVVLLDAVHTDGHLRNLSDAKPDWDALKAIAECDADVVVELSYTDLKTGEPARTHLRAALERGKHVITTNKGPIALHYAELAALAREHGVVIGVEGTVMSGTPSLRLGKELLAAAGVRRIQGILNGTTNYILSRMEQGATYPAALAEAQAEGYAEADPTGDVEGYDAAAKIVILSHLIFGTAISMTDVKRTGITGLSVDDIVQAKMNRERWKMIGSLECVDGKVVASVAPVCLSVDHPLASVGGATNAITFSTELLGDVTLIGPGAGRIQTGYAIIADLLSIDRSFRS
jgi:homoserine dehydrogenase